MRRVQYVLLEMPWPRAAVAMFVFAFALGDSQVRKHRWAFHGQRSRWCLPFFVALRV